MELLCYSKAHKITALSSMEADFMGLASPLFRRNSPVASEWYELILNNLKTNKNSFFYIFVPKILAILVIGNKGV